MSRCGSRQEPADDDIEQHDRLPRRRGVHPRSVGPRARPAAGDARRRPWPMSSYGRVRGGARPRARAQAARPARPGRGVLGRHRRTPVTRAYVGLGSNLGDREQAIRQAAERIGAVRLSGIRETEPWGYADQPDFLNAVAEVETELCPRELLDFLLDVEHDLGRERRRGTTLRPAHDRPRPSALRRRGDRRAGPDGAASSSARATLRAGTARRARPGARRPGPRHGGRAARSATLSRI